MFRRDQNSDTISDRKSVKLTASFLVILILSVLFTNEIPSFHNHDVILSHSHCSHSESDEIEISSKSDACPYIIWNLNSGDTAADIISSCLLEITRSQIIISLVNNLFGIEELAYFSRGPPILMV